MKWMNFSQPLSKRSSPYCMFSFTHDKFTAQHILIDEITFSSFNSFLYDHDYWNYRIIFLDTVFSSLVLTLFVFTIISRTFFDLQLFFGDPRQQHILLIFYKMHFNLYALPYSSLLHYLFSQILVKLISLWYVFITIGCDCSPLRSANVCQVVCESDFKSVRESVPECPVCLWASRQPDLGYLTANLALYFLYIL